MIELVLIDDHPSVRLGLRDVLVDAGIDVIGEAASAAEGLALIEQTTPDVAVVDLRLPDQDGASLCRTIRARFPTLACIVYSAGEDIDLLVEAVNAGVSGLVLKGSPIAELIHAIGVVADGGEVFPMELADRLVIALRSRTRDSPTADLTDQESLILDLLADGHTNREIGKELALAEKTVRNRISMILRKLGLRDRTQAALYALRHRK